jgi:hypothetical protein
MTGLGDLPQSNSVYEPRQTLADDPSTAQDPANRSIYLARHVIGLSTHPCTAEPGPTIANNHRVSRRDHPLKGPLISMSGPAQELVEQKIAVPTLAAPTPAIGGPHLRNRNGGLTRLCHDGTFCDEEDVCASGVGAVDVNWLGAACVRRFWFFLTESGGLTMCPAADGAGVGSAADGGVAGCAKRVFLGWTGWTGWTGRALGCAALVAVGAALLAGSVVLAADRLGRGGLPGCSRCCGDVEGAEVG